MQLATLPIELWMRVSGQVTISEHFLDIRIACGRHKTLNYSWREGGREKGWGKEKSSSGIRTQFMHPIVGDFTVCLSVIQDTIVPVLNCAIMAYGGVDIQIHVFLASALAGSEWPGSCPGRFIPGKAPEPTGQGVGWVPEAAWTKMKET